jgi:hypothetical protein
MIPETGSKQEFKRAVLEVVQGYACAACGCGETYDAEWLNSSLLDSSHWKYLIKAFPERLCHRCNERAYPRISVITVDTCGV